MLRKGVSVAVVASFHLLCQFAANLNKNMYIKFPHFVAIAYMKYCPKNSRVFLQLKSNLII